MRRVRSQLALAAVALAAVALAAACGGGSRPPPPPSGTYTLSGTVTYDFVPTTELGGLSYSATVPKPVRGAVVEVRTGDLAAVLQSTTTDQAGAWSITWTGTSAVAVRVNAQTLSPPMRVQDNTNADPVSGPPLYALQYAPVDATVTTTLNLNAGSGWTGSGYGGPRAAAPFAVLDSMYSAARAFLAVRSPVFPELRLNWSVNNRPQSGSVSTGAIGTSHYDPAAGQIYILGQANVDTDEYDSHVIVHEWGHYLEDRLSRADSPGGPHSFGQRKDPRLAFSEGWGNALGAMVFYPDDLYADTSGTAQGATQIAFHLEPNTAVDSDPGWWSEMSVAHFLYDVFDSPVPDDDPVALGLGPIYDVLAGPQKVTPAFTTLFSFVDALKRAQPAQAANLDAMLSGRSIASPVQDAWGTGETHDGGWPANLPVYQTLTVNGASATASFVGGPSLNDLQQSRFLRFTGIGALATVSAGSISVDVSLKVWHVGSLVGASDVFVHGVETVFGFPTVAGDSYVVFVNGWEGVLSPSPYDGLPYSVPVAVTSP